MSTNAYRLPALQPYPIVRLLPFWGRCWCTGSRRQPLRRRNLCTRERAHEDFVDTICAYIENWLFGFCWAFQSFRKRCYQHQNRTTGATLLHSIPKNDTSSTYWSCRALKSHVLALMGAVRQYQSHTAGTCQNPTLRRLYSLPTLSRNETVENETNTANVASESERSEAIRKPRMRRNAQSRKY